MSGTTRKNARAEATVLRVGKRYKQTEVGRLADLVQKRERKLTDAKRKLKAAKEKL